MKKYFMFLFAFIMIFSNMLASYALIFTDVAENAWFYTFVNDLTDKRVINGYPDGTFKPDNKVTLGEYLKLIMTASTGDRVNYKMVEVESDHWAEPYLRVAENYGVVEKGQYTIESLDNEISRMEIVRILTNCDIIINGSRQVSSKKRFVDTTELSEDDLVYLGHAIGIGVISGDAEGTFRPNDGLIRSECAKVIYMYSDK